MTRRRLSPKAEAQKELILDMLVGFYRSDWIAAKLDVPEADVRLIYLRWRAGIRKKQKV